MIRKLHISIGLLLGVMFFVNMEYRSQPFSQEGKVLGDKLMLKGKVIDERDQPISYATVAVYRVADSSLVTGVSTNDKGRFFMETLAGNYYVKVSFIAYREKIISTIPTKGGSFDMGSIQLEEYTSILDEFEVTAVENAVELQLDKRVIKVADQNTNAGETAVEVLENTPSVQTDGDGNITLRGSASFTLLINGVPTAMDATNALQTIPASTIDNIEVITNPSAKYDAEGVSGIINVITKKKTLEGISLIGSLTGGTFDNYLGDVAVSYGKRNFLVNAGINANTTHNPRDIDKTRTTTTDSSVSIIKSVGEGAWKRNSYGGNVELQWMPGNHNITLNGSYTKRKMVPYFYLNIDEFNDDTLSTSYENRQDNIYDMENSSLGLYYRYNIKGATNHHITFKAISNQHDVDQLDSAMYYNQNNELIGGTKYKEVGPSDFVRFNLDYYLPLGKGSVEAGGQVQLGTSADAGKSFFFDDISREFVFNDQFSTDVAYTRDVHAGYIIVKNEFKKLVYQAGLRGEYTFRNVSAINLPNFVTINRMDWFPSIHLAYDWGNKGQFTMNYSTRIQRPRSWYFEPFVVWETEFNVRSGNPDLTPEYINVFEINWSKQLGKKGNILVSAYHNRTEGVINRVSSVYAENIIITRPFNTGKAYYYGLEPTFKYLVTKNWTINNALNLFYNELLGEIDEIPYNSSAINFSNRLTNSLSLKNNWMLQLVVRYTSENNTPQGSKAGFFEVDASIRKSFLEGKYALNLQARNLLGTKVNDNLIVNESLYLRRINTPRFPMIKLTFSMRLNNYEKIKSHHKAADEF